VAQYRGEPHAFALADGRLHRLAALGFPAARPDPLLELIRGGLDPAEVARRVAASTVAAVHPDEVTLLAPLARPGKVIAVGLNYREHSAEFGMAVPTQPILFDKWSTSIISTDADIRVRADTTNQLDFEVELTAVVGRRCGPGEPGTLGHVFGYTVANDVTARDIQDVEPQWTRSKSFDGFCPVGPYVTTADQVRDPQALAITLSVNGERMQDGNTVDMIFSVEHLLRWITQASTLEPGDLILTGTPSGVGAKRNPPRFLVDGDVMVAEVAGLGTVRNTIRIDPAPAVHGQRAGELADSKAER
jgi:2-keto-4-pentenoate hydratase/2-oxohepta-3-ene-1,7-dioic acid hydratase in catechol pathway